MFVEVLHGCFFEFGEVPLTGKNCAAHFLQLLIKAHRFFTFAGRQISVALTAKIEAAGEGEKVTADGVRGDDTPYRVEYTAQYDGKDNPITGSPIADTVSLKRLDANTTERTDKKAGKVVQTLTRKLSSDGKTATITVKGTDAEGRPINNLAVFEKQ